MGLDPCIKHLLLYCQDGQYKTHGIHLDILPVGFTKFVHTILNAFELVKRQVRHTTKLSRIGLKGDNF